MKTRVVFMFLLPFVVCDRKPPPRPKLLRGYIPAAIEPQKDATTKAYVAATTQPPSIVSAPQIIINLVAPSTPRTDGSQIQVSAPSHAASIADSKPAAAAAPAPSPSAAAPPPSPSAAAPPPLSSAPASPPPPSETASIAIEPEKVGDSDNEQDPEVETPSLPEVPSQPEATSQPKVPYQPEALSQPEAELAAHYEAEALKDNQSGLKYKLVPQVIYKKVLEEDSVPVKSPATRPPLPKPQSTPKPVFTRRPPATTSYPIRTTTQRVTTKAPPPHPPARTPSPQKPEPFKTNFDCKDGNGYYAVDNECDSYIECKYDQAKKYWCPDGLHFNPNAKRYEYPCAYPSAVMCNAGAQQQSSKPTNQCPRQYGFFPMRDGDCSKYVVCQNGAATIMPCPAGLAFNPRTENCDYVENVPQCNPNVFKDYQCPEAPLDEDGFVSDIVYKYKYENQCKNYIACQRGFPRLLSCEHGLAFDDQWQACINEDYVEDCAKI